MNHEGDLQRYAERKMPFFNLVVSIWQHNLALENTLGIGFTKSVFVHSNGMCELNASNKEMENMAKKALKLIKKKSPRFKEWYKKAKKLNKEADDLIEKYSKNVKLDKKSYNEALEVFVDNFGYCTIIPYWILYAINQELENGVSKKYFKNVLEMYEELKSETRYPQLVQNVINKYFDEAAKMLGISRELATCIHPEELGDIISGNIIVTKSELENRMKWCAITRDDEPMNVKLSFDKKSFDTTSQVEVNVKEIMGNVAFKGIVRGKAKIVNSIDDMEKFKDGNVLVSIQSSPALMPAIRKASSIVTDEGGIMCHAAVISRELKKPCIIGTKIATKVLKDGDLVEVNAETGVVKILKKA